MEPDHLKFSPDILSRLGEELNPNPDQGIVELVRNSYDADAVNCQVELKNTDRPGGQLRVTDDGVGMSADSIRSGWLVLGRSPKQEKVITDLGRRPVGSKGLGRLAALRLGAAATILTRPKLEPRNQYRLEIVWSRYDTADVVEAVPLEIQKETRATGDANGTIIEVDNLRMAVTKNDVTRLARALILLADPFSTSLGFRPTLVAPEFSDLERLVQNSYFDEADFHLVAKLDKRGRATATVRDYAGKTLFSGTHADIAQQSQREKGYGSPSATFELWIFTLDKTFATRSVSMTEVREWLAHFGGIHLYHQALRVHPYGDRGHDWLDMNLARARNPELRPSTNNSIGRIEVNDPSDLLTQKTDRSGFIENEGFLELRKFAVDALDWMARRRLQDRDQKKLKEKLEIPRDTSSAKASVEKALKKVTPRRRKVLARAFSSYEHARDREAKTLREDVQLYRTLSTVGTTFAVLAHEIRKPVRQIESMARTIERRAKKELDGRYNEVLEKPVSYIIRAADALKTFGNVTDTLLDRRKRRPGRVDIRDVVTTLIKLFDPLFQEAGIECHAEFDDHAPYLLGTVAALESALANLMTNSLNAFNSERAKPEDRRIIIRTLSSRNNVRVTVLDSGPGIRGLEVKDIWLPGQTTTPGGTGLGLTIVRDVVADLGGSVTAVPSGEMGGAEVAIELPVIAEGS